jgi:hypothetical protein
MMRQPTGQGKSDSARSSLDSFKTKLSSYETQFANALYLFSLMDGIRLPPKDDYDERTN